MHFYWRIIEELKYLNENWVIRDPNLLRAYERWVGKNAGTIAMSNQCPKGGNKGIFQYKGLVCSVN